MSIKSNIFDVVLLIYTIYRSDKHKSDDNIVSLMPAKTFEVGVMLTVVPIVTITFSCQGI